MKEFIIQSITHITDVLPVWRDEKYMLIDDFDPFCNILESIKESIGGELEYSCISDNIWNLDLVRNDDFRELRRNQSPDGFLFSRYLIEIEPNEDVGEEFYITTVSHLLNELWRGGYKAVTSCNFEDLLPNKGGYNHHNR